VLSVADGASVQVQLLGGDGYSWPTEVVDIEQRYSDALPARLRVLTADAFAAAKLGPGSIAERLATSTTCGR